ncbi:MAG: carboxylesterase family protein [Myxococcota bacterium]
MSDVRRTSWGLVLAAGVALLACGRLPPGTDDGGEIQAKDGGGTTQPDAGTEVDGGAQDGGATDAGGADAGGSDGGLRCPAGAAPCVETTEGPILGVALAGGVRVFRGVPFAEPPVGSLRWRPPRSPAPRAALLHTQAFGPPCPQVNTDAGSEDCLTLNVWTPPNAANAPVMVWIHGGGFAIGEGSTPLFDGEQFAAGQQVVLVTIQYRLGNLGFLAHPAFVAEEGTAGNYGVRDQVQALEWLRDNARAFGGDPDNVTIFGESAGGVSVCALLGVPSARGLFHRAISQSGPCFDDRAFQHLHARTPSLNPEAPLRESGVEQGTRYSAAVGCADAGTPAGEAACLRGLALQTILTTLPASVTPYANPGDPPPTTYYPMSDGTYDRDRDGTPEHTAGSEAFLPVFPSEAPVHGASADVPLVLGANGDEGLLFALALRVDTVPEYQAMMDLTFGSGSACVQTMYPASSAFNARRAFADVLGDGQFVSLVRRTARARVAAGKPTYVYHFTHEPEGPLVGSYHGAEIAFVFGNLPGRASAAEEALSAHMQAYWAAFARTGVPAVSSLRVWPPYSVSAGTCASDPLLEFRVNPQADPCASPVDGGVRLIHDRRAAFSDFWDTFLARAPDAGTCP